MSQSPASHRPQLTSADAEFLSGLNSHDAADAGDLKIALPAAYDELRRIAARYLHAERPGHTLQPTALVHEAYLRLLDQKALDYKNRAHFLGIAARMMRRILTNHAVARTAAKRGGADTVRLPLDEALDFHAERHVSVIAVDEALRELQTLDARQAQIVELRFFGGLTIEEIAEVLELSVARVRREWSTAKLWLKAQLSAAA
jgi:RNA polymerase sigma factor (TIGR02999 family)